MPDWWYSQDASPVHALENLALVSSGMADILLKVICRDAVKRPAHLTVLMILAFVCSSSLCRAGIRGPGKYCGVVVFDRWGGCTLYSGVYVMYVSEKTKEGLRPYAGQSIQIDAKEVYQPKNPGDGRIGKFEYLGPAPETRSWVRLNDVRLRTAVQPGDDGKAVARITVENQGDKPVRLFGGELALTLLTKQEGRTRRWSPSDGPSYALMTRQSLLGIGAYGARLERERTEIGQPYVWTIGKEDALPGDFTLAPQERKVVAVKFDVPDGQYDCLSGYGGGVHQDKCLASNRCGFDIEKGRVVVVPAGNR